MKHVFFKKSRIASFLLVVMLFASYPQTTKAGCWTILPDLAANDFIVWAYERIQNLIQAQLQKEAIKQAVKQLEKALNTGDSPRVIEDFDDYLHTSIEEASREIVINNFNMDSLRGRTTGNYEISSAQAGKRGSGINKTYYDILSDAVTKELGADGSRGSSGIDRVADFCAFDDYGILIQEETPDYFSCFEAVLGANPMGEAIKAREQYDALVQREKENKILMATSSGVLPGIGKDGKVQTPNIITEEFQKAKVYLPLDQLTNAQTIEQVIASLVSVMISDYINKQTE